MPGPRIAVLIVAAGSGQRFGGPIPKQYRDLAGQTVLRRTVLAFADHPAIDTVLVAIDPDRRDLYDRATAGLDLPPPVAGGATRQESVANGLDRLAEAPTPPDRVLVHDGARPLTDADTIDRVIAALDRYDGAIAAVPVTDTLKRADAAGLSQGTVPRDGLWRAQTPQGFRFAALRAAHRAAAGRGLTDDAAVAEAAGLSVALVEANEANLKITTETDLVRAAALLHPTGPAPAAAWETRVGNGFDVHRFGPGDRVTLGGIEIPHDAGLVGHSDADVGLHTLTDAIFGALSDGDIGHHFPPSDPQWKGCDSTVFLKYAADRVTARGGEIRHLDLTIMCERPKLGPHRDAMRRRIADLLGLPVDRVAVKATTTEKLGFTGRGEGIAAMATATLRLPETA